MRNVAMVLVASVLGACVVHTKPAGGAKPAPSSKESGRKMDATRMKADLLREQREQDARQSRDDFLGRNQTP